MGWVFVKLVVHRVYIYGLLHEELDKQTLEKTVLAFHGENSSERLAKLSLSWSCLSSTNEWERSHWISLTKLQVELDGAGPWPDGTFDFFFFFALPSDNGPPFLNNSTVVTTPLVYSCYRTVLRR